jgi:hypothetical protein
MAAGPTEKLRDTKPRLLCAESRKKQICRKKMR